MQIAWTALLPLILGIVLIAYASNSACSSSSSNPSSFQTMLLAAFSGIAFAFCGMMLLGTGTGIGALISGGGDGNSS